MKKLFKSDLKLVVALAVCLLLNFFLLFGLRSASTDYEEMLCTKFLASEEKLRLKSDVYVITVPSIYNESSTETEKTEMETQQIEKLKYIVENTLHTSKGVFILGTELLSDLSAERRCMPAFRNAGNVYWHYNSRNIGYYHVGDKCCQIKFLDSYHGNDNRFEVLGEGSYSRNYLPYFMMTMENGTVEYDKDRRTYTMKNKTGEHVLHAMEDGTIRSRETSKFGVVYKNLDSFYEEAKKYKNADKYKDAVIFFQDRNTLSKYAGGASRSQDLADYYINVLGTIQNDATVPALKFSQKMYFVMAGALLIGLFVVFTVDWVCVLAYFLEICAVALADFFLIERGILYLPVVDFFISITFVFVILLTIKKVLKRISMRNLPIDAVIRFTNTIVNIEHSVSYSEYLMKNRSEIEDDISASLLLPVMDQESFLLKELAAENYRNRRFVENQFWNTPAGTSTSVIQTRTNLFQGQNYVAFVPLPVFDAESELVTFTVIGLKKKLKPQRASYISMMLFSMYIYFKAQHERGEHQRMYFSMLSLMISVIDAKDPVTAGHSQRVANISKDIGIWLKLSKNEQFDLEFTALLHDIGKIGVSDYVLNKQSVYTQSDFEQMKYHTIRGAEMLSEVGISEEIIDGVRHHHERIDGKGYPDGLKGDELSLFAKIIKIADVYDALSSKRQYKEAWEIDKALNIIYKGRGTEFDTEIANVFIDHMSPPGWIPPIDERAAGERKNPNTEKAAQIVRDFYRKYKQYLSVEYPIPSKKAVNIDFFRENGFMEYDWGETFNNASFLEEKPMILAYEKETKSLIFGQGSKANGVNSIYYYFFKGFVNMGIYLLFPMETKKVLSQLTERYGEPIIMDEQMTVYETRKMRIVFYHTFDDKFLLFYISDYMCGNYILESAKTDESKELIGTT